ncbi:hypothetical protein J6590_042268 [Homalodisca vitripennis]|nr:hypothetical protein J6590_042268 [Homalodisca vitripennis]
MTWKGQGSQSRAPQSPPCYERCVLCLPRVVVTAINTTHNRAVDNGHKNIIYYELRVCEMSAGGARSPGTRPPIVVFVV